MLRVLFYGSKKRFKTAICNRRDMMLENHEELTQEQITYHTGYVHGMDFVLKTIANLEMKELEKFKKELERNDL
jgi:hypothetical protein